MKTFYVLRTQAPFMVTKLPLSKGADYGDAVEEYLSKFPNEEQDTQNGLFYLKGDEKCITNCTAIVTDESLLKNGFVTIFLAYNNFDKSLIDFVRLFVKFTWKKKYA